MANKKAVSMTTGISGLEIVIWYNDANNRVGAVEWTVPSGVAIRVRVWDSNSQPPSIAVVDRTEGQGNGAVNVPGSYRMVQVLDDEGEVNIELPPNLTHTFNVETIG